MLDLNRQTVIAIGERGGGNLAKAVAEALGCTSASGADVKAFCCGPAHALVLGLGEKRNALTGVR